MYRGDSRSPTQLRDAGGFLPSKSNANDDGYGIFQHTHLPRMKDSTQYVFTSKEMGIAAVYAVSQPGNDGSMPSWIYLIRPTPNFINARKTLGSYAVDFSHHEFAALGGIRFEQVLGWVEIDVSPYLEYQLKTMPSAFGELKEQILSAEFTLNADYNPKLDDSIASDVVPQLTGFPPSHQAWER